MTLTSLLESRNATGTLVLSAWLSTHWCGSQFARLHNEGRRTLMVDPREYERHSNLLEEQMRRISLVGPRLLQAIRAAVVGGAPHQLISDAEALGQELSGQPGEGALEVYRDLDSNLQSTRRFISRWKDSSHPCAQYVIKAALEMERELEQMSNLVASTPPDVMARIKQVLTAHFGTEKQQYDYRGSSAVMVIVLVGIILLRYFEVISISWWIVWPLGLSAAVAVAALISTIIYKR